MRGLTAVKCGEKRESRPSVLSVRPILPGHERRSTIGRASMSRPYSTMCARCFLISGVPIFWGSAIDMKDCKDQAHSFRILKLKNISTSREITARSIDATRLSIFSMFEMFVNA